MILIKQPTRGANTGTFRPSSARRTKPRLHSPPGWTSLQVSDVQRYFLHPDHPFGQVSERLCPGVTTGYVRRVRESRGAQYSAVARRLPRKKRAYLLHRDRHTNRRREGPPRLAAQIQRRNSPFFNRKASGPNSHGGSTCRSLLIFRRDHP